MNLKKIIKRELREWLEFIVINIPGGIGFYMRSFYYQKRMVKTFKNNRFESGFKMEYPRNIQLGSNSYFGSNCKIFATELSKVKIGSRASFNANVMINARGKGKIIIGDNVLIGPNVVIRSNNHSFDTTKFPIIDQGMIEGEIIINDDVWIGSNAVILPNCKIGKGVIVAAGAVVTSDVESYSVVGGVPANLIKKRDLSK